MMKIWGRFLLAAVVLAAGNLIAQSPVAAAPNSGEWVRAMQALRQQVAAARRGVDESDWHATEPVRTPKKGQSCTIEETVDLHATLPNGKKSLWTHMAWNDGQVNQLKCAPNAAVYAYRTFNARDAVRMTIELASADSFQVWLNKKIVCTKDQPAAGAVRVALELAKGKNELLIKLTSPRDTTGFLYRSGPVLATELDKLAQTWPEETGLFVNYYSSSARWFSDDSGNARNEQSAIGNLLRKVKAPAESAQLESLTKAKTAASDPAWLGLFLTAARKVQAAEEAITMAKSIDLVAMRRAIADLAKTYPDKYPNAAAFLQRLAALEQQAPAVEKALAAGDSAVVAEFAQQAGALRFEALVLSNPVIDFDKLLVVKRDEKRLCLPHNWQGNSSVSPATINEIDSFAIRQKNAPLQRVFKPAQDVFVGDLNLHWDGDRMLLSSIGANNRWQVFELKTDGTGLRPVTPGEFDDIDNYNGVYLPDGRIIFDSSSTFCGVPCVGGADYVANLHLLSADGKTVRRLTFDQDNDWYPTVMPDGRIMYLRWEYTDSAHYFSRVLMSMNPDGTDQTAYYGSNSYWPNAMFYAKPLPGKPGMFCAIVSGHHGVARMGELVVFNANKSRKEQVGAVQRIPGCGKVVEDVVQDGLVNSSWPKYLHPYPLNDKYFLVACKPSQSLNWGLYLVDTFDNLILLKEAPGFALLEPIPLRKTDVPPAIPDRVDLTKTTARVSIQDIYSGPGIAGVPPGTVKALRIFQYEYSYRNMGGHYVVGMEGPWDVRRMIGTVPVHKDGSAVFTIPANTPVAIQPLDADGKALQQMRSWFVGMPGETISCTGCHEPQNASLTTRINDALRQPAVTPAPWYGPKRGFAFLRDVQPVLDKYCSGCHDGKAPNRPNFTDTNIVHTTTGSPLPNSYLNLHPYVRRNGPEGDYHLLTPLEFHADTSELVQILQKGHHNVKLDAEAWDRLITWIDLNVPCYGTWKETRGSIPNNFEKRRYDMKKLYANVDEDIEAVVETYTNKAAFVAPPPETPRPASVTLAGWPLDAAKTAQMQQALGQSEFALDLGNGLTMKFKKIPAGEFVMGDVNGADDEYPTAAVKIDKPFWMGVTEVSLVQYQAFDSKHNNGYYDMHYKDQVKPGYLMDDPTFPVIRVSWTEALAFCRWLAQKSGKKVTLPTEAQWEWACRAGTATALSYGGLDDDFSKFENLGDVQLRKLAVQGVNPQPIKNPDKFWDFVPKEERFDDGVLHLAAVDSHEGNRWGIKNMHGNVREWTLSNYRPYPYNAAAGVNDATATGKKVVRGGSWYERPKFARSAWRLAFPDWEKVYNVGFRIIIED